MGLGAPQLETGSNAPIGSRASSAPHVVNAHFSCDLATSLENYAVLLRATGRSTEMAKLEARAKAIPAKSE